MVLTPARDVISDDIVKVIKNLPNLESLEFITTGSGVYQLSDHFVKCLLYSTIKRFKCVNAGFRYERTFVAADFPQTKLEDLNLSSSCTLTDALIAFIALKSPNLKTLNIKGSSHITAKGIYCIAVFCPLLECVAISTDNAINVVDILTAQCKNLHTLDFRSTGSSGHSADILRVVGKQCPTLKHLVAEGMSGSSYRCGIKAGIDAFARGCPLLTFLDISNSNIFGSCIDDKVLNVVAEKAVNLKELRIGLSTVINNVSVVVNAVAKKCRKLEVLTILSRDMKGLNFASHHQSMLCLKQLKLPFSNITATCIENVTKVCPNLEILDLRGCFNLTDQALITIIENCPDLRCFFLSGNYSLANKVNYSMIGVTALANRLHKLQSLAVCTKLIEVVKCAMLLVEKCPFLNTLTVEYNSKKGDMSQKIKKSLEKQKEELKQTVLSLRSNCVVERPIGAFNIKMTSMFP